VSAHRRLWLGAAVLMGAVLALGFLAGRLLHDAGSPMALWLDGLAVLVALGVGAAALWVHRRLLEPQRRLARALEAALAGRPVERGELVARAGAMTELGVRSAQLVERLETARAGLDEIRRETAAASERERRKLAAILKDLSEGLIHCTIDGRILLYNDAAVRLLGAAPGLGLGRVLWGVITREPVAHQLNLLRRAAQEEGRPLVGEPFVAAGADNGTLLRCRLSLVGESPPGADGFILVFEEVTAGALDAGTRFLERLERAWRGPLGSLRAAGELLGEELDQDAPGAGFARVVVDEARQLDTVLTGLGEEARAIVLRQWPLFDVASDDLLALLRERLASRTRPIRLDIAGQPVWIAADAAVLGAMLADFAVAIAEHANLHALEARVVARPTGPLLLLAWSGATPGRDWLERWMAAPMTSAALPFTPRDVLDRHECEPWLAPVRDEQLMALHLPLQPARGSHPFRAAPVLPSRPEFYDFGMMGGDRGAAEALAQPLRSLSYVVFDTETTGLEPRDDAILQLSAVRVVNGRVLQGEVLDVLVDPGRPIPPSSIRFHGITDAMVAGKPPIEVALSRFKRFCGDSVLVAHNAAFDMAFLQKDAERAGLRFDNPVLDTLLLSAYLHDHEGDHSLDRVAERLGVTIRGRHTALGDSIATAELLVRLLELLEVRGVTTLGEAIGVTQSMTEVRRLQRRGPAERRAHG
jgi:DNA polymerase-3 subunit epsilon